jgi:hypothetical protein
MLGVPISYIQSPAPQVEGAVTKTKKIIIDKYRDKKSIFWAPLISGIKGVKYYLVHLAAFKI